MGRNKKKEKPLFVIEPITWEFMAPPKNYPCLFCEEEAIWKLTLSGGPGRRVIKEPSWQDKYRREPEKPPDLTLVLCGRHAEMFRNRKNWTRNGLLSFVSALASKRHTEIVEGSQGRARKRSRKKKGES